MASYWHPAPQDKGQQTYVSPTAYGFPPPTYQSYANPGYPSYPLHTFFEQSAHPSVGPVAPPSGTSHPPVSWNGYTPVDSAAAYFGSAPTASAATSPAQAPPKPSAYPATVQQFGNDPSLNNVTDQLNASGRKRKYPRYSNPGPGKLNKNQAPKNKQKGGFKKTNNEPPLKKQKLRSKKNTDHGKPALNSASVATKQISKSFGEGSPSNIQSHQTNGNGAHTLRPMQENPISLAQEFPSHSNAAVLCEQTASASGSVGSDSNLYKAYSFFRVPEGLSNRQAQNLRKMHENAKEIINVLHECGIGYRELCAEDLDPDCLKVLYNELGIDVQHSSRQPEPISVVPHHESSQQYTGEHVPTNLYQLASSSIQATKAPPPQPSRNVSTAMQPTIPSSLERKDYIAQMMALKARKSSSNEHIPAYSQSEPLDRDEGDFDTPNQTNDLMPIKKPQLKKFHDNSNPAATLVDLRENARRAVKATLAARSHKDVSVESSRVSREALGVSDDGDATDKISGSENMREHEAAEPKSPAEREVERVLPADINPSVQTLAEELASTESMQIDHSDVDILPGLFMTKPTTSHFSSEDESQESTETNRQACHSGVVVNERPDIESSMIAAAPDHAILSIEPRELAHEEHEVDFGDPASQNPTAVQLQNTLDDDFVSFSDSGQTQSVQNPSDFPGTSQNLSAISNVRSHTSLPHPPLQHTPSMQQTLTYQELKIQEMKRQIELAELKKKLKVRQTATPSVSVASQHAKPSAPSRDATAQRGMDERTARIVEATENQLANSNGRLSATPGDRLSSSHSHLDTSPPIVAPVSSQNFQERPDVELQDRAIASGEALLAGLSNSYEKVSSMLPQSVNSDAIGHKVQAIRTSLAEQSQKQFAMNLNENSSEESAFEISRLASLQAQMDELRSKIRQRQDVKDSYVKELESQHISPEGIPDDRSQKAHDASADKEERRRSLEQAWIGNGVSLPSRFENDLTSEDGTPTASNIGMPQLNEHLRRSHSSQSPIFENLVQHEAETDDQNELQTVEACSIASSDDANQDRSSASQGTGVRLENSFRGASNTDRRSSVVSGTSSAQPRPVPRDAHVSSRYSSTSARDLGDAEASSDNMDIEQSQESAGDDMEADVEDNSDIPSDDAWQENDYSPAPNNPLPTMSSHSHVPISPDIGVSPVDEEDYEPPQPHQEDHSSAPYTYDLEEEEYEPPDAAYESYLFNEESSADQSALQINGDVELQTALFNEVYSGEGFANTANHEGVRNTNEDESEESYVADEYVPDIQPGHESDGIESGELESDQEIDDSDAYSP